MKAPRRAKRAKPTRKPAGGEDGDLRQAPWRTLISSVHPNPTVKINHGSTFMVTDQAGTVPLEAGECGLYAADTRFVSRHELRLNGRRPETVASVRLSYRHARWHLIADDVAGAAGDMRGARVAVTVNRLLSSNRLHEDLVLHTYGRTPLTLMLEIALESDFADLFEVRFKQWQRRAELNTNWLSPNRLEAHYRHEDFVRRCVVRTLSDEAGVSYANGSLRFPVELTPGEDWRVCLQYDLLTSDGALPALASRCEFEVEGEGEPQLQSRRWQSSVTQVDPADIRLQFAYERAIEDLAALRLHEQAGSSDQWMPAAGLPWFMALFGRDSLIASMQAMIAEPSVANGTLANLARWQADFDDPVRDAEPGKIPHELRVGEWAHFGLVPHRPYYGTADATPLYLLLLAEHHRWLGDVAALTPFKRVAEGCLDWIDKHGDRDGDGFQEYGPRSPKGYRNQAWRDAHDGVLDEAGVFPDLPIGTCEMQAYVYGAKVQMAPLFDAWGDVERAARLRQEAAELRRRFHETFWLDQPGAVAFAIDGKKRALGTVTSNPGHCLWMGILDARRGRMAGERLLQRDLFSGWGLRTLSELHPSYDPHSYQRGSVWPHDTVIAAAGLRRYGLDQQAWQMMDGLLAAVMCFEDIQMPELFSGLPKEEPAVPVPYRMANVPQAWAAGAVVHMVRILLGLEPDMPAGRLYVNPALPPWCPRLTLEDLHVGPHRIHLRVDRASDGSCTVDVDPPPGIEVVRGTPPWMEIHS